MRPTTSWREPCMAVALYLFELCIVHRVHAILEQPASSKAFLLEAVVKMMGLPGNVVRMVAYDACGWGARPSDWNSLEGDVRIRKPTSLLSYGARAESLGRTCADQPAHTHVAIMGKDRFGKVRSAAAAAYTERMCNCWAMEMGDACAHGEQPPEVKEFVMRPLEEWIPHPAVRRYWERQKECIRQGREALPPLGKKSALPRWVPELCTELAQEEVMVRVSCCPGVRREVLPADLQGLDGYLWRSEKCTKVPALLTLSITQGEMFTGQSWAMELGRGQEGSAEGSRRGWELSVHKARTMLATGLLIFFPVRQQGSAMKAFGSQRGVGEAQELPVRNEEATVQPVALEEDEEDQGEAKDQGWTEMAAFRKEMAEGQRADRLLKEIID